MYNKTDNSFVKNNLSHWVMQLSKQNCVNSAIDFFMKSIDQSVLYFEYKNVEAWLVLKNSHNINISSSLCFRLHESDPAFEPSALYNPQKINIFNSHIQKIFGTKNYSCFPIVFNKQVVAVIVYLTDNASIKNKLFILNNYIINYLWKNKWEQQNTTYELTNCLNKKSFFTQLFIEVSRARFLRSPLSLILLELDQFKTLESSYGEYKTMIFMKSLARNLIQDSRCYDIFGSWSGGGIGIILPHTSEKSAGVKAEKIRWSIQSADFSKVFSAVDRFTLSLGLAEYPKVERCADSLFRSTLKALSYSRKECGGNKTAVVTPSENFTPDFYAQNTNNLRDVMR